MKKLFAIIPMLAVMVSFSHAQQKIIIDSNRIDNIVKTFRDSLKIPGIAVAITVNNEIRYSKVFGFANMETHTELTVNSVWHICSVSKQFAAVACLKLAGEKKLSLNDKISNYIDNLPPSYSNIRIFNLLSQTSGVKDYLNEKQLYGLPWEKVFSQVIADTLNFKPGDEWRYSNTGFWMIARIIEKVSGMNYDQYLAQNFFTALGMSQTKRISGDRNLDPRVKGYVFEDDKYMDPDNNTNEFYGQGDGDLMSTLGDLVKWNIALTHGKVIKKELLTELWTPSRLNNGNLLEISPGSGINYGLGWFIKSIEGNKIVWTPGAGFGFSMSSQYIQRHDLGIIVFCNKEQFLMADGIGFAIAGNILQ